MKQFVYYAAIVGAFVSICIVGVFICASARSTGTFPMLAIMACAFGAAKFTGSRLKDRLNPEPPEEFRSFPPRKQ